MNDLINLLNTEPRYRLNQIFKAWFDMRLNSYEEITTLSKDLRARLKNEKWLAVEQAAIESSKIDDTKKVLLRLEDGNLVESVLMGRKNKKDSAKTDDRRYTICISTQVGCPMGCVFCATGKMGFKRNLSWREIVDEVRFWQKHLFLETAGQGQISNIVLMGQGEPLLNYDNVKEALRIILDNTEIGPRQITVSTVGVPNIMEKMVDDKDWPPVRFALSLHNAIESERAALIPSHQKDFLDWLILWSKKYHARFSSRTQFIGIEYTLVPNENDSEKHLRALIKLASKLGKVRINLIPLNSGVFAKGDSKSEVLKHWHEELMKKGFTSTIRLSQGQDISAACGQLASKAC